MRQLYPFAKLLLLCGVTFVISMIVSHDLSGQTLDINIPVGTDPESYKCGPIDTFTVNVENSDPLLDAMGVTAEIVLPANITLIGVGSPATIVSGNTISLPDISAGGMLSFEFYSQVSCDFTDADYNITVNIITGGSGTYTSGNISVFEADLSITSVDPRIWGVYRGLVDTISANVVNGSFGSLDTFSYCVNDPGNLTLRGVEVAGVALSAGGGTNEPGMTCFLVTGQALMAAGVGSTLDEAEGIVVEEFWEVNSCVSNPEQIDRRANYGCQGNVDCRDKPQGVFQGTVQDFELLFPRIAVRTESVHRPVCYGDESTEIAMRFTNTGDAPASSVSFRIYTSSNPSMIIDMNSVTATLPDGTPISSPIVNRIRAYGNSCFGANMPRDVEFTLDIGSLAPDSSVIVNYELTHECSCSGNSCRVRNIYDSRFVLLGYEDLCDRPFNTTVFIQPSASYDAFMQGYVEGPGTLVAGDSDCIRYNVTSTQLDWLVGSTFPNAYMEATFTLPPGLDYDANSFRLVDRDGTVWNTEVDITYIDNNNMSDDDELLVRIGQGPEGVPPGFALSAGMFFEYCVTADCSEKPVPTAADCSRAYYDIEYGASFEMITDPGCTNCGTKEIWCVDDVGVRLACPPGPGVCPPCQGLRFTNLEFERVNFGEGDADNDQIPDGVLDQTIIRRNRFLQGDTIKVTMEGRVNDIDSDFDYGFATIPFTHSNFTPLSAEVFIRDASTSTDYNCTVILQADYTTNRIIADFSPATLNSLGCGFGAEFEDEDSISLCVFYTSKNAINDPFQLVEFEPSFYLSEDDFEQGTTYQCNTRREQMTQIGFTTSASTRGNSFGACEIPIDWRIDLGRYIGAQITDEFPGEIRTIGLPDRIVFTKPSQFNHRIDEWAYRLDQAILSSDILVNNYSDPTPKIPAQFFNINGDDVTFYIKDYLESLGYNTIPPDEGYRTFLYPRIQGGCNAEAGTYQFSYQIFESVEANIFCTDEIENPVRQRGFRYDGAAELEVITGFQSIRVCSGADTISVEVANLTQQDAANSFLYPQVTGGVLIQSVFDAAGNELMPNQFGIYELGTIDGGDSRELNVVFRVNSCGTEEAKFFAGWACDGYPQTIDDADCQDESTVVITTPLSQVDMNIISPAQNLTQQVDPCEDVDYEVEIISSDLGYIRDLLLNFRLPPGQVYVPGTFELAIPGVSRSGTYMPVMDPMSIGGNRYEIDLSSLDQTLQNVGLVGSKDVTRNTISVRFRTNTGCGFLSRSRALFVLTSNNACGDPLRPVRRRAGRVRYIRNQPTLSTTVESSQLDMNACNNDVATVSAKVTIEEGVSTNLDSIRITLPAGIEYIPNSYVPGPNAPAGNNPERIRVINGVTVLNWSTVSGLSAGDMITFDVDVQAVDVGQVCTVYDVMIQAYSTFEIVCNGITCTAGEVAGEGSQEITIEKSDLDFTTMDGSVTINSDGTSTASFSAKVMNSGAPLATGNEVSISIYEDVNTNGTVESGTDRYLFSIKDTLDTPLLNGEMVVITGMQTIATSGLCSVIGVLEMDSVCVCSERTSDLIRPEIIYDIQDQYSVCSGDPISIGPSPVGGLTYEWLPEGGSDISNLSSTTTSMTTFTAPRNLTGSPRDYSYLLRSSYAPCYTDNVVTITVEPEYTERVRINACMGQPYDLPTTSATNATNFVWTPSAGLSISADGRYATIDNVSGPGTYVLSFETGTGCGSSLVVEVNVQNCGPDPTTALGDKVWFDIDEDGIQDAGEPGIEGVPVNLIDANTGYVISSTLTDSNGEYLFDDLPAGNYAVEFIPLPGFVFTSQDTGGDDTIDSDADTSTGRTPGRYVALNEADVTYDAGFIPDCNLMISVEENNCVPNSSNTGLERAYTIYLEWSGNPYTYDQFNDGADTIEINIPGLTTTPIEVVIEELSGNTSIGISTTATGPFTATAAFRESSGCMAMDMIAASDPCIFDLALIKIASEVQPTPGLHEYGDTICMDIIVVNQGMQDVENVEVWDFLPDGLTFDPSLNLSFAVDNGSRLVGTIPGRLEVMESDTITLCAISTRVASAANDNFVNIAEIKSFTDTLNNDLSNYDIDSTPDDDPDNDAGGEPGGPTDDQLDGNGTDDEDDHDAYEYSIFDLALTKELVTPGPYIMGQELTYNMILTNQGSVPATDVEITDYLPTGMFAFDPAHPDNGSWSATVTSGSPFDLLTATVPGPVAPAEVVTVPLTVTFRPTRPITMVNDTVNYAEISAFADENGDPITDADSNPDTDPDNDAGGEPNSDADDATGGDGSGMVGSDDSSGDEDDSDPGVLSTELTSLGSTVFHDDNDNGLQDAGEVGIAGVTLELYADFNNDGMIGADETTPITTTMTDGSGNYIFENLAPGFYQVVIPASNFNAGQSLGPTAIISSVYDEYDNQQDADNNGFQPDGQGTIVRSPVITLRPGEEPLDGSGLRDEFGQGAGLDAIDENGDMTVDFGFACNVDLTAVDGIMDLCRGSRLDLTTWTTVSPNVPGVWSTSGDGEFLDMNGSVVDPAVSDQVVFYAPGPGEISNGEAVITFTVAASGTCDEVSSSLTINIKRVNCGNFPWGGGN